MSEQDDLVIKIDDLAKHIGEAVSTKLSKADASESYAAKSSLKSLAYKDKVEAADISDSVLENLVGPQGPQGFGYYGGYIYKNLTLDEWKTLGVLGSTHTYEVGDTSNIRIGDFGLVVGAVTDLTTTQALINFKVTGITSNSISTISLGFIVGEPGNADSVDLSDLVTKEELAEFDSDVVHKTGDEVIEGLKTFHHSAADTHLSMVDTAMDVTTAPSAFRGRAFRIYDKNDNIVGDTRFRQETTGEVNAALVARYTAPNASKYTVTLKVTPNANGVAGNYSVTLNNKELATQEWSDANFMKLTGDQTVAGLKTYTSNFYSKKATPMVVLQNTNITKGTTPSSNQTATILVSDATGTGSAASLLRVISYYTTAGDNICRIAVYKPATGTDWKGLDLTYKANGTTTMTWAGENVALFNSSNQLKFPNGNLLWIA